MLTRFVKRGRPLRLVGVLVTISGCGDSQSSEEDERDSSGGNQATGGTGASSGKGGTSESGGTSGNGASGGRAGGSGSGTGGSAGSQGGSGGAPPHELGPNAIASTNFGTCALDAEGAIHCWGLAPETWPVPSGSFVSIHSSDWLVCAVRDDGTVACFVEPWDGGVDTSIAPSGRVRDIALALGGLCGIDETGTTFCNHASGAFSALVPPPPDRLSAIAVGYQFACGILASDSTLLCWGSAGTEACDWAPVAGQLDAPDGTFVQVSSRYLATCAVATDGSLGCWGAGEPNDDPAELCRDGTFNHGQSSPPSGTYRSVSMGTGHGCAVRDDGTVACWGIGTSDSNCGGGGSECGQAMPPSGTFDQVAVGAAHTCAMRTDRTVVCWGYDGDDRTTPPPPFQ